MAKKRRAKKASQRTRIGGSYVTRTKDGRFKKFTSVGKSTRADRRKKTKKKLKKRGHGNRGDYRK